MWKQFSKIIYEIFKLIKYLLIFIYNMKKINKIFIYS